MEIPPETLAKVLLDIPEVWMTQLPLTHLRNYRSITSPAAILKLFIKFITITLPPFNNSVAKTDSVRFAAIYTYTIEKLGYPTELLPKGKIHFLVVFSMGKLAAKHQDLVPTDGNNSN